MFIRFFFQSLSFSTRFLQNLVSKILSFVYSLGWILGYYRISELQCEYKSVVVHETQLTSLTIWALFMCINYLAKRSQKRVFTFFYCTSFKFLPVKLFVLLFSQCSIFFRKFLFWAVKKVLLFIQNFQNSLIYQYRGEHKLENIIFRFFNK